MRTGFVLGGRGSYPWQAEVREIVDGLLTGDSFLIEGWDSAEPDRLSDDFSVGIPPVVQFSDDQIIESAYGLDALVGLTPEQALDLVAYGISPDDLAS